MEHRKGTVFKELCVREMSSVKEGWRVELGNRVVMSCLRSQGEIRPPLLAAYYVKE